MQLDMMFDARGEREEMDEADKEKVAEYVQNRVGGLRCPDHHQVPTVVVAGTRLDNISFSVNGCCNKIIQLVKEKLEA